MNRRYNLPDNFFEGVTYTRLIVDGNQTAVFGFRKGNENLIGKTLNPGYFLKHIPRVKSPANVRSGSPQRSYQYPTGLRHYFLKENAVGKLNNLMAKLGERFAPFFRGFHSHTGTNVTRDMEVGTMQDRYKAHSENSWRTTETLVTSIAKLHGIFGRNWKTLYGGVITGRRKTIALKPRTGDEEKTRWKNYIRIIIAKRSREFREFYSREYVSLREPTTDPKKKRTELNNAIERFVENIGGVSSLDDFVDDFIDTDRRILYGTSEDLIVYTKGPKTGARHEHQLELERQVDLLSDFYSRGLLTIIHGDAYPQNIFDVEQRDDLEVCACDFEEMRADRRVLDLVAPIYTNVYAMPKNNPEEIRAFNLIAKYVDLANEAEPDAAINIERTIICSQESRLKEAIRLYAIDCQLSVPEIREYSNGLEQFKDVPNAELRNKFLSMMFERTLKWLWDYNITGEGESFMSNMEDANLLKEQMEKARNFFSKTGIIEGSTPSHRRQTEFQSMLSTH